MYNIEITDNSGANQRVYRLGYFRLDTYATIEAAQEWIFAAFPQLRNRNYVASFTYRIVEAK